MRSTSWAISGLAVLGVVLAGTGASRGSAAVSVSGQVTIQEREGEVTEDIQNVVVYLEPVGAPSSKAPKLAVTKTSIALQSRQFSPRVRVITEGSKVEFPNQDPFNHNVFSKLNGGFDTGVYGRGKTKDQVFKEAGVYPIYCNVHPRMTAFVIALTTPYFTQAGNDGRFTLENVPPGAYKMHVWHDRATQVDQDLTVSATGVANVRVQLDARGYKYVQHKNKLGKDYTTAAGDRY
ncbi:MAG TPA: carboxypeptidase regulatory-like domain-containing protein [Gemmatimonadaceae bacterium]